MRQGYLLTPYFFFIIGEILNHCIKREARQGQIMGIELPGVVESQIITQFADDTLLSLAAQERSVLATRDNFSKFCRASTLFINEGKSSAYFRHPRDLPRTP